MGEQLSLAAKSFSLFKRDAFLFVTNLVTGVVVARKLGPAALGLWVILQMILGFAEAFGRLKFDAAAVYFLGKKKYRVHDVVVTLNALAILSSMLTIGVILWQFDRLYDLLFANSTTDVRFFMYVILLQIPLQFLSMNYSYLYMQREQVAIYNTMIMIRALGSSVLSISLLVCFDMGLAAVVVSSIVSVAVALLYAVVNFGSTGKGRYSVKPGLLRDLMSYGFKLYVGVIIGYLNGYLSRLILVLHLPPAQVAYFSMAQNQGQLLNKVPDALNIMLYPRISKMECDADSARLTANAFRVVLLILSIVGATGFILIEPLVYLLYGQAFLPMIDPFRIMLPGLVLSGATNVIDSYFSGIGKADISAKIATAPLIIQVATALLLIPAIGLAGAAVAFLMALVVLSFAQIVIFLRLSDCTFRGDILIRKSDVKIVFNFVKSLPRRFAAT